MIQNFRATADTKLLWHSAEAEKTWKPRLPLINVAAFQAERLSVLEGLRPACQQVMFPNQALEAMAWAMSNGLKTRILGQVGAFSGFSHRYPEGDDMVILGMGKTNEALTEGPDDGTDLGYPDCCRKFWALHFPEISDPVWQWASDSDIQTDTIEYKNGQGFSPNRFVTATKKVDSPAETNPTLRYWGIRLAPHIPCGPLCEGSFVRGSQFRALMGEPGDWARDLLLLPTHWSSYRGVVIVKNRFFRIVAPGDAWAERYHLHVNGEV